MITRNNYEEYFLLLADNELSVEEANAVKQFAAQHPDLAEELDILLSCRLDIGSMPVFPKEKLMRPVQWNAKEPEMVQTRLLLLLDNELPAAEKQQLEKEIAASATLQTDWNTLQQTKLVAEAIIYPHKATLQYSNRKVRPLLWMRWATAAAILTGLGWFFWLQQEPQNLPTTDNTANHPVKSEQKSPALLSAQTLPPPIAESARPIPPTAVTTTTALMQNAATAPLQNTVPPQETAVHLASNNSTPTTGNPYTENTPAESEPSISRTHNASIHLPLAATEPAPAAQIAHLDPQTVPLPVLTANRQTESFTGSKTDLAAAEEDYVTIGGAHVNKQKMRGLFRNVTRAVARSFTKSKIEPDVYVTR